ncbi:MAG: hypothetical protein E7600_01905 [Ruminococcaceae bacterium]|nr:hypothetical protein [Oscillospiraceae bacterium]
MLFCLCSCAQDRFEKERLCSTLYSHYSTKADFIISDGENNTSGKADISKRDTTTVTFSEPSVYGGISIKSDNTGNADTFIFELSGIPAKVPKSLSGDLSLIFSLFSDNIPTKIKSLDSTAFRESSRKDKNGKALTEVSFIENGYNYTVTYDKDTGIPQSIDAGNDKLSVSIELSDFKTINNQQ